MVTPQYLAEIPFHQMDATGALGRDRRVGDSRKADSPGVLWRIRPFQQDRYLGLGPIVPAGSQRPALVCPLEILDTRRKHAGTGE